jgi:hypothetical protein
MRWSISMRSPELPGRCHVRRLGRCVSGAGSNAALACARAAVPSLRSLFPPAPWLLCSYSCLFPPSDRACVSLSAGAPFSLCFSGNPSFGGLRPGRLLVVSTPDESHSEGSLVPIIRLALP